MSQSSGASRKLSGLLCARAYGLWPVVLSGNSCHSAFISFILFAFTKHLPDNSGQLFAYHRAGDMFAAAPLHFLEVFLYHRIIPIGDNGCLVEGDPQIPVAIFVFAAMAMFTARILTARYQPAITNELFIRWKPAISPISATTVQAQTNPNPGRTLSRSTFS